MTKTAKTKLPSTQKKRRQAWPEILRLIFISLILYGHFVGTHTQMLPYVFGFDGGTFGVTAFLLLSGFYNAKSQKNRTKFFLVKFLIWVFWGFIIYLPCYYSHIQVDNPFAIFFGKFLSGKYSSWWFLWTYLGLTLFQQYLNKFVQKNNKWIVFGILVIAFMIFVPFTTVSVTAKYKFWYFTFEKMFLFVLMYTIGVWFSYHWKDKLNKTKSTKFIWLVSLAVAAFVLLLFSRHIRSFLADHQFEFPATEFFQSFSFVIIALSWIFLFDNFPQIKINWLNNSFLFLGKITLAMYLMHPITWTLLDCVWATSPATYIASFYWGKFFAYYFIAIGVAILMHLFISFQEKLVWSVINKIKSSKGKKLTNKK